MPTVTDTEVMGSPATLDATDTRLDATDTRLDATDTRLDATDTQLVYTPKRHYPQAGNIFFISRNTWKSYFLFLQALATSH